MMKTSMNATNALFKVSFIIIRKLEFSLSVDIVFHCDFKSNDFWLSGINVKEADEQPLGISREFNMLHKAIMSFWLGFKFGDLFTTSIIDENLSLLPYNKDMLVRNYNDSLNCMVNWDCLNLGNTVRFNVSE